MKDNRCPKKIIRMVTDLRREADMDVPEEIEK
jgi:hypothetical protein